jgi:hypothetical protein
MNLDMPEANIVALSHAGECAAERLIDRFHLASNAGTAGGWENHQEVRLRTFLALLEEIALDVRESTRAGEWDAVIERLAATSYKKYTLAEAELARDYLRRLVAIADAKETSGESLSDKAHQPRATIRIAPRI